MQTGTSAHQQSGSKTDKKRPRDDAAADVLCSFCQAKPAAVRVALPSLKKRNKRLPTPFCLLHYYTTSAVRVEGVVPNIGGGGANSSITNNNSSASGAAGASTAGVTVINRQAFEEQLPAQQELFAEAFVQLRGELQEASIQQFSAHKNDPLAILNDLAHSTAITRNNKKRPALKAPPKKKRDVIDQNAGGFLRDVPVPERLRKTQQQQLRQQQELTARMQRAARDTTMRRQPTRKSIWNVMLDDDDKDNVDDRKPAPVSSTINHAAAEESNYKVCTCGSQRVETVSSNASNRNQDMAKAETWGNKDRGGEIITRYRCNACGKTWNEEEY